MSKKSLHDWERKRKTEQEEFMHGWNWKTVVQHWRERVEYFSVKIDSLFTEMRIYDSENPIGREPQLSWWPVSEARDIHLRLQEYFDRYPGTIGNVHPNFQDIRRGELDTLEYLWEARNSIETTCALLIAASLFPRMHSSRSYYPKDYWPSFNCTEALYEMARLRLDNCSELRFYNWHYSCTDVLPNSNFDYDYSFNTLRGLVRYLA